MLAGAEHLFSSSFRLCDKRTIIVVINQTFDEKNINLAIIQMHELEALD